MHVCQAVSMSPLCVMLRLMRLVLCHEFPDVEEALVRLQEARGKRERSGDSRNHGAASHTAQYPDRLVLQTHMGLGDDSRAFAAIWCLSHTEVSPICPTHKHDREFGETPIA